MVLNILSKSSVYDHTSQIGVYIFGMTSNYKNSNQVLGDEVESYLNTQCVLCTTTITPDSLYKHINVNISENHKILLFDPQAKYKRMNLKFKNQVQKPNVLFINKDNSNDQYYFFDFNKMKLTKIIKNDFLRREYPVCSYKNIRCKYNCTYAITKNVLNSIFSDIQLFPTYGSVFNNESHFEVQGMLNNFSSIKYFYCKHIKHIPLILEGLSFIGKTSRIIDTSLDCITRNSDYINFTTKLIYWAESVYRFISTGSSNALDLGMFIAKTVDVFFFCYTSWSTQGLDTGLLALLAGLLPKNLLDVVMKYNMLTSKKLFDETNLLYSFFSFLSSLIENLILVCPEGTKEVFDSILKCIGLQEYILISRMHNIFKDWKSDKHVMLSVDFRNKVKNVQNDIVSMSFTKYTGKIKMFGDVYADFITIYKGVISYESVRRVEPTLFVLEGPPGTRKSVTVSKLLQVLKWTHYSTTLVSTNEPKVFFDAYNNEDVIIIDDVGAKGIIQWSQFVTWVSPVKCPLLCAAVDRKDTKFLNSHTIIVTTNCFSKMQGITKADNISTPEALWRRGYVFDYSEFSNMSGIIKFKHYNIHSGPMSFWEEDFPAEFKNYLTKNNILLFGGKLNPIHNFTSWTNLLAWMSTIVIGFNKMKELQFSENNLDSLSIETIRSLNPFCNEETFYDALNQGKKPKISSFFNEESEIEDDEMFEIDKMYKDEFLNNLKDTPIPEIIDAPKKEYFSKYSILSILQDFYDNTQNIFVNELPKLVGCVLSFNVETALKSFAIVSAAILAIGSVSGIIKVIVDRYKTKKKDAIENIVLKDESLTHHEMIAENKDILISYTDTKLFNLIPNIAKHIFKIRISYASSFPTVEARDGFCIMSTRFVIFPSHYLCKPGIPKITIFKNKGVNDTLISECPISIVENWIKSDIAIGRLAHGFSTPIKKIAHAFKPIEDNEKPSYMLVPEGALDIEGKLFPPTNTTAIRVSGVHTYFLKNNVNGYMYSDLQYVGLCGVPITTKRGNIIGIHIAGSDTDKTGVSSIWPEYIRDRIFEILDGPDTGLKLDNTTLSDKVFENHSGIKLNENFHISSIKSSNFKPSPLYGIFPISRVPVNLSENGPHTIKDLAKKARSPSAIVFDDELLFTAKCLRTYFKKFGNLSEKEIVGGTSILNKINKKSSNGILPPDYKNILHNKESCFDYSNSCYKPEFREVYASFKGKMSEGKVSVNDIVSFGALKDELQRPGKAPRVFNVLPVTMHVLTKECFGQLVEHLYNERWNDNEIMIGINPFQEWNRLYNRITRGKLWAGDIKLWDKKMPVGVELLLADVIMEFYTGPDYTAARNCIENLAFTIVALNDDTFINNHSLPSGSWLTAVFNSLINKMYTCMWYYRYYKATFHKEPSVLDFKKDICNPVYGDDGIVVTLNPLLEKSHNAISMAEFFESMDMEYTTSLKGKIVEPFESVDKITFLKREFTYHAALESIVCPLDLKTIYSSLSWIDTSKENLDQVIQDKLSAFQREIFLHFPLWEKDMCILRDACNDKNIDLKEHNIQYLIDLYRSGEYDLYYGVSLGLHPISPLPNDGFINQNLIPYLSTYKNLPQCSVWNKVRKEECAFVQNSNICIQSQKTINITSMKTIKEDNFSGLITRDAIYVPKVYNKLLPADTLPSDTRMDFSRMIGKPFLVETISWASTVANATEFNRLGFPSSIMSNQLASTPFDTSTYYQVESCAMLQLSGTPMHQGLIIVAAIPPGAPKVTNINAILSAPHVFLNANEATSVCLELPMYIGSNFAKTQFNGFIPNYTELKTLTNRPTHDFCDLVFFAVNGLEYGPSATNTLSVSVHAIMEKEEFYVPKEGILKYQTAGMNLLYKLPTTLLNDGATGLKKVAGDVIDYARNTVKSLTGFHHPITGVDDNKSLVRYTRNQNNVDTSTASFVLDPHAKFSRIYDNHYFRTDIDEMDISYLLQKPAYIGQFGVSSTTTAGSILFTNPITPMFEAGVIGTDAIISYWSLMRLLYECSRHWRGKLRLHIQSVCTNFHYTKLVVTRNYSTDVNLLTKFLKYENIHNLNTETLEFSAGGQIHTIDLPFASNLRQLECTKDYIANALMHGLVSIYLMQPLVSSSSVPSKIYFNVYMSAGDDFEFSGYASDPLELIGGVAPVYPTPAPVPAITTSNGFPLSSEVEPILIMDTQSESITYDVNTPSLNFVHQSNEVTVSSSSQETIENPTSNDILPSTIKQSFQPNRSIRDYLRYQHPYAALRYTPSAKSGVYTIGLNQFFYPSKYSDALAAISSAFFGLSGGLNIKIKMVGANSANVTFVPPSHAYNPTYLPTSFLPNVGLPNAVGSTALILENNGYAPTIKPFNLPSQTMQDYVRPYSSIDPSTFQARASNSFEFDVYVPNCNMHNIISGSDKYFDDTFPPSPAFNLGKLNLGIIASSPDNLSFEPVYIYIYVGLADESRVGFQVFNLQKKVASQLINSQLCRSGPFYFEYASGIANHIPLANLSLSGAYYRRV